MAVILPPKYKSITKPGNKLYVVLSFLDQDNISGLSGYFNFKSEVKNWNTSLAFRIKDDLGFIRKLFEKGYLDVLLFLSLGSRIPKSVKVFPIEDDTGLKASCPYCGHIIQTTLYEPPFENFSESQESISTNKIRCKSCNNEFRLYMKFYSQ